MSWNVNSFGGKVRREVPVTQFLEWHTSIPIPHVPHFGVAQKSLGQLDPFTVIEYIDHEHDPVHVLDTPELEDQEWPILDAQISEERLVSHMAKRKISCFNSQRICL